MDSTGTVTVNQFTASVAGLLDHLDPHSAALLQDRDGFLWIGTGNGLNRYDGHHTWTWRQPAGTEATQVTGIIQGRDGRIHACFSEHAVATFSSSGSTFFTPE